MRSERKENVFDIAVVIVGNVVFAVVVATDVEAAVVAFKVAAVAITVVAC